MVNGIVLIIDDNPNVLSALEILLLPEYKKVITLNDPNKLDTITTLNEVDLVLLDMNFTATIKSGSEGLQWLEEIKRRVPAVKIIMITAYGDVELAVTAIKNGASDFILKPWNNESLLSTLKTAYFHKKAKTANKDQKKDVKTKQPIIGNSKVFLQTLGIIHKVSKLDVNVFIAGEKGTGKELLAKELQFHSARKEQSLIVIDMAAIQENNIEKELWGFDHESGKIEQAHQGILFIDNIEKLPLDLQWKLLNCLQQQQIARINSTKEIPIDIRLIASAHSDLKRAVQQGTFRQDLLYLISTISVEVPPLRNRGNDIIELADFYLDEFKIKYQKNDIELHSTAKQKMLEYSWSGNVRELKHSLERAVILNTGPYIREEDLTLEHNTNFTAQNPITLSEMELVMIEKALSDHQGNYSAAASQLGISRQTLYNKIKKLYPND